MRYLLFVCLATLGLSCFPDALGDPFFSGKWTRKAAYSGGVAYGAVAFVIGSKAYVGTGNAQEQGASAPKNDFWEYNPQSDTWTQKSNFGGGARSYTVGFSIGGFGYVGLGYPNNQTEFWKYDPAADTWTQIADFGGLPRASAVVFIINGKAYVGTGIFQTALSDFWVYIPDSNLWRPIASYPGGPVGNAVAFAIGSKGYVGTGSVGTNFQNQIWEYDPATNTWSAKVNFPGGVRSEAIAYAIGNNEYVGIGRGGVNDLWEYDSAGDSWKRTAFFPVGGNNVGMTSFSIDSKAYIGLGSQDLWELDP